MKRILITAIIAVCAISSWGATTTPVQLLNPTGSASGQAIVSTGPGSAPAWGNLSAGSLGSQASNTVVANVTGSSASPTAFAMPSCSTSASALTYTSNTGFTCNTAINAGTLSNSNSNLVTTQTTPNGSVGQGPITIQTTRTGGFGQYGNVLANYLVTAATPAAQFDVALTGWASHTNLTGGQLFGGWTGANTPSKYLGETYSSGAAIGHEINVGNRWANFGLQNDIAGTRYTVGLQLVPDVLPASDGVNTTPVTISVASPAVITLANHGYTVNMGVVFGGSGTLPTGLTAGTTYYVSATGLNTNDFRVSATIGGALINTTGSFVAPITVLPSYPGSFASVVSPSVHGHQWYTSDLIRTDSIASGGVALNHNGGSVSTDAPTTWAKVSGFWGTGLDLSAGSYSSTNAIALGNLQAIQFGSSTNVLFGTSGVMQVNGPLKMGNAAFTPLSTSGIVGTITNDNANAGSFGEYATNTTSSTSLTTSVVANCTSVSLTAGDWDVTGVVQFNAGATTTIQYIIGGISTTSATLGTLGTFSQLTNQTTGAITYLTAPTVRISVASTTTVFLVGESVFGVSTMNCSGLIRARRVR